MKHCCEIQIGSFPMHPYSQLPGPKDRLHHLFLFQSGNACVKEYLSLLDDEEKCRFNRFKRAEGARRYALMHGFLRIIASRYCSSPSQKLDFGKTLRGKPCLSGCPFHFNISYTGDYAGIALSNKEIGLDLEKLNPDFKYQDIVDSYFSEGEKNIIKREGLEAFFRLWTQKEAFLKYIGVGISKLPEIDFSVSPAVIIPEKGMRGKRFFIQSGEVHDMVFSICNETSCEDFLFYELREDNLGEIFEEHALRSDNSGYK